eukprot:7596792-Alexandrium_andersonii.AAC.1
MDAWRSTNLCPTNRATQLATTTATASNSTDGDSMQVAGDTGIDGGNGNHMRKDKSHACHR